MGRREGEFRGGSEGGREYILEWEGVLYSRGERSKYETVQTHPPMLYLL